MSIETGTIAVRENLCTESLHCLAGAFLDEVHGSGNPVDTLLALFALFHGLANRMDDRPVSTAETDDCASRLAPLLAILSGDGVSEETRSSILAELNRIRDLIPA